jgi:hypothetical protein
MAEHPKLGFTELWGSIWLVVNASTRQSLGTEKTSVHIDLFLTANDSGSSSSLRSSFRW